MGYPYTAVLLFYYFFLSLFIFERQRREKHRIQSRLQAVSTELNAGLEPTNHRRIMTQAEAGTQPTEPPRRPPYSAGLNECCLTQTILREQNKTVCLCPTGGSSHSQCGGLLCLQRRTSISDTQFPTWPPHPHLGLPASTSAPPLLPIHIWEATWCFSQEYLLIHLPRTHAGFFIK